MKDRFLSADEKLLATGIFSDVRLHCGEREWRLHRNILCTRSVWFEKALNVTSNWTEAQTGEVHIQNFSPETVDWLVQYIYTGTCDIPKLRAERKTHFVTSIEVYNVGDYFNMTTLADIAVSFLTSEFDARIGPMQLSNDPVDFMDDFVEAIKLVYEDTSVFDTSATPIRSAFIAFVHATRYHFLQDEAFCGLLDEVPVFALDLFRVMRSGGDFVADLPDMHCSLCHSRPNRLEKPYFTHVAPTTLRLLTSCSNCAAKKMLPPPTEACTFKKGLH